MNQNLRKGMFMSSLARAAVRLGLLSVLACCFFWPAPAQGQVKRLFFTVKTGDDDLRGGNDNLNVTINFRDGNVQLKPDVNHSQRWADNTTHMFEIALQRPVPLSEIASIYLKTTAGGFPSDEWHMASVSVRAMGAGIDRIIATHGFMEFPDGYHILRMLVTMAEPGKANKLELTFKTGDDDLGGGDFASLNVTLHFRSGATQSVENINGGQAWANSSAHVKDITLNQAVDPSDIVKVDLKKWAGGVSWDSDNWDMDSVSIRAIGDGVDKVIARHGFFRFTQSETSLSIPIARSEPGKANKLELNIQTGGDDLRGDNDNLNIVIHFRGGHTQRANNINGGRAWKNLSAHVETITLDHAADPSDIVEVDLQTTFTGGTGGDNWDMDSITVKAIGEDVNEVLFRHGARRFTHDNGLLVLRRGQ